MDRAGYMEAMLHLVHERGYDAVGIAEISAQAGGEEAELERLFGDKLGCAVAVLEAIAASNLEVVRGAYERPQRWPDSLRAAAYAHAGWVVENPEKARFGLLETVWVSELTGALRDRLFGEYIAMVDDGREIAADPGSIPAFTAEGVVGAIAEVVARRLGQRQSGELIELVPEMMYLAVRPYLGEEAARRELTAPPPGR